MDRRAGERPGWRKGEPVYLGPRTLPLGGLQGMATKLFVPRTIPFEPVAVHTVFCGRPIL